MRKILLILSLGIATQFIFASKSAVYGDSISKLERKVKEIELENQRLEIEIASANSLTEISKTSPEAVYEMSMKSPKDFSVALKR